MILLYLNHVFVWPKLLVGHKTNIGVKSGKLPQARWMKISYCNKKIKVWVRLHVGSGSDYENLPMQQTEIFELKT